MNIFRGDPKVHAWLAHPISSDVGAAIERIAQTEDVRHVAIMPDVHMAEQVCVGTVMATGQTLLPDAVGGDIGCGMAAVAFDAGSDLLADESAATCLLEALRKAVPTNRHSGPRDARSLPAKLSDLPLSHTSLSKLRDREGVVQLGTLGRGNHFLEFQADEQGMLWLMVHSGSRAMGQAIRNWHASRANLTKTGLRQIDAATEAGRAYVSDMNWARDYAVANRFAMTQAAADVVDRLFGIRVIEGSYFDCDHNHVALENHFGKTWWVHRKGACPAGEQQAGMIPGSMGTASFHTLGRGNADSLHSSSHGAGRAMSRSDAMRRVRMSDFMRTMRDTWFDRGHAHRLIEEAPDAYKDIREVVRAQRELTRVVRRLKPLLSYKGI